MDTYKETLPNEIISYLNNLSDYSLNLSEKFLN